MEEARDPKAAVNVTTDASAGGHGGRDAEATSDETLGDLEESQQVNSKSTGGTDTSGGNSASAPVAPSPDGSFDESGSKSDGSEPM